MPEIFRWRDHWAREMPNNGLSSRSPAVRFQLAVPAARVVAALMNCRRDTVVGMGSCPWFGYSFTWYGESSQKNRAK
jgi:hypothetical protein